MPRNLSHFAHSLRLHLKYKLEHCSLCARIYAVNAQLSRKEFIYVLFVELWGLGQS